MRSPAALFDQQTASNAHTQTKSLAEMPGNSNKENKMTEPTQAVETTSKEEQVNAVIDSSLTVAFPFIPGGAVAKVAAASGLSHELVHLGFMFAHLFSHPKVAPIVQAALPPAAPVAPLPDPAEAAKKARIKELQVELA